MHVKKRSTDLGQAEILTQRPQAVQFSAKRRSISFGFNIGSSSFLFYYCIVRYLPDMAFFDKNVLFLGGSIRRTILYANENLFLKGIDAHPFS
jgi:hypothetical protein